MTVHTKRRVVVGAVALFLALPTETILLKALTTPNQKAAAQQYVQSLTPTQLSTAASSIESYPFAYRRAIMAALPSDQQAAVWQNHIESYVAANPGIDPLAANALRSVLGLLTPTFFSAPASDAELSEIQAAADQLTASLGTDTAKNLLYYLGPPDGTFTSSEPLTEKLAETVRQWLAVYAQGQGQQCDCNLGWGCDTGNSCAAGTGCSPYSTWPACGWLWESPCNGLCGGGIGA